jgi:hypothetical protein
MLREVRDKAKRAGLGDRVRWPKAIWRSLPLKRPAWMRFF